MTTITSYDQDVVKWSEEQAHYLLTRQFDKLDLEHLADEVLDVGKSEFRELESRTEVLLAHLIKWAYQPTHRGQSWLLTIDEQRDKIHKRMRKTPSIKSKMRDPEEDFWGSAWKTARRIAARETELHFSVFPEEIPWTPEQVLTDDWLPETTI